MIHRIPSSKDKGSYYDVSLDSGLESCTCPDHKFRNVKCKHIFQAIEKEKIMETEETKTIVVSGNEIKNEENKNIQSSYRKSIDDEVEQAKMMLTSGMLPMCYKTPQQVIAACKLAHECGLQPFTALRQIAVIQGKPSLWGDLPKAMVDKSGKMESFDEYVITKDYVRICFDNKNLHEDPWAAVCRVKRRGNDSICERFFSVKDAEKAGLFRNPTWKSYPGTMLKYRARSQALKDLFPDCLNGVAITEYDEDTTVVGDEVVETKSTSDLNERFR